MEFVSPFRYPGSKRRFRNCIFEVIKGVIDCTDYYVEPFVGGGSIFLEMYNRYPHIPTTINDADKAVSSFWECVFTEQYIKLLEKIEQVDVTVQEHERQRKFLYSEDDLERAFAALFLNRTSFSGIITSGPIGGKGQESKYTVDCRYNKEKLIKAISDIHDRINTIVLSLDFEDVIKQYDLPNTLIYCDPPYYVKGDSLYPCKMSDEDHKRLCECLMNLKNAFFILSYDNHDEIRKMYNWANITPIDARYSITGKDRKSWNKSKELIISNEAF